MLPIPYLRQLLGSLLSRRRQLIKRSYLLPSKALEREVMIDVYRPTVPPWRLLSLAVFNDGQDLPKMQLTGQLREQYTDGALVPLIVVGVHAGDRLREYGTVDQKDYQGRGDRAPAYERFLLDELIPWLEGRFNIYHDPFRRAIAGFSLGGLSAFDLAWRNPKEFGVAAVFSGALWWRHSAFDPADPDANRIVHDYVRKAKKAPPVRYWFMAGTDDEKDDRNHNGIIDAIDDTLQLMGLLAAKGKREGEDFTYVEVPGGRHDPETWGRVIIDFLRWVG
ncbi:alpha/beta hydrolase-fold protein [Neolewinella lacunae]|uniref:Esterase family protein n=1 Tax=Neolewinella lacunae TaxID=1517758 RepID=A0A923PKV8_9BACT|nr:alpha/beta hydrolase-fold protein [Neolewinella lacunae]MBC6994415.1 esterase family protein [Neolewinella lacunae]MDN3633346.1 alpha/beta hydrolase-fold protein [Neolewinella lacunae]